MSRLQPSPGPALTSLVAQQTSPRPSFLENLSSLTNVASWDNLSAGMVNNVGSSIAFALEGVGYERDPSYLLDEQELKSLMVGIDDDLAPMFASAKSQQHAFVIRDRAATISASRRQLAEGGWGGAMAGMMGQLLDPTAVASMVAGPAALSVAARGMTAGRAAVMTRSASLVASGLANATASAVLEGIRQSVDPNANARDFFSAVIGDFAYGVAGPMSASMRAANRFAIGGLAQASGTAITAPFASGEAERDSLMFEFMTNFALGSTFNAVLPSGIDDLNISMHEAHRRAQMRANVAAARATGATLTPEGVAAHAEVLSPEAIVRDTEALYTIHGLDSETIAASVGDDKSNFSMRVTRGKDQTDAEWSETQRLASATIRDAQVAASIVVPSERLRRRGGATPADEVAVTTSGEIRPPDGSGVAFWTEKGSAYRVSSDGARTVRNKKRRAEHGNEQGIQPESARTVYVDPNQINRLSRVQVITPDGIPYSIGFDGDKVAVIGTNSKGEPAPFADSVVAFESAPRVGLAPVEVWNDGSVHFGNTIVRMEANRTPSDEAAAQATARNITLGGPAAVSNTPQFTGTLRQDFKFGDFDASGANISKTYMPKLLGVNLRFSIGALVGQSEDDLVRLIGNAVATDGTRKVDGSSNVGLIGQVETRVRGETFRANGEVLSIYRNEYGAEANARGETPLNQEEYAKAVGRASRRLGTTDPELTDTATIRAAKHAKKVRDDAADFAGRHGARGFISFEQAYANYKRDTASHGPNGPLSLQDFATEVQVLMAQTDTTNANRHMVDAADSFTRDPSNLPRMWKRELLADLQERYGEDRAIEVIQNSILSETQRRNGTITPDDVEVARSMARSTLKNGGKRGGPLKSGATIDRTEFIKDLKENGLSDAQVGRAVRLAFGDPTQAARNPRAMRRAMLDETYVHEFADGSRVAIEDLIENNIEVLNAHYLQQVYGAAAFAELARVVKQNFDIDITWPDDLVAKLRGRLDDPNDTDITRVQALTRLMMGQQINEPGDNFTAATLSVMRTTSAVNQFSYMSAPSASIYTIGDFIRAGLNPVVGFRAIANSFPGLKALIGATTKGEYGRSLVVNYMIERGLGSSRITGRSLTTGTFEQADAMGKFNHVERWSRKLANFGTDVSGNRVMQDGAELVLSASVMQKFVDIAESGKPIGKKAMKVLSQFNIDGAMAERIIQSIRRESLRTPEGKVYWPNPENWTDVVAASKFDNYVVALTRRELNVTDPSTEAMWMAHPAAKLMLQFRKFAVRSWENTFIPSIQNGMSFAATRFAIGSIQGALTYASAVLMNAAFGAAWADDEYLSKRLSEEQIALAAFGRATWTSLMPTGVDIALQLTGNNALFAGQRQFHNQAGPGILNALAANPTMDRVQSFLNAVPSLRAPLDPNYDLSQQHMNAAHRAFLGSFPLFRPIVQEINTYLPRQAQPATE